MKKRILNLLIGIIILIPINVKADMGAPVIQSYEAVVAKDNATIYKYDYDKEELEVITTIPKGTKVEVIYEEKHNNALYGNVVYKESSNYLIKISDLMLANAKFDLNKAYNVPKTKVYVCSDDVYLYNGPSKTYSKVSNEAIPRGTILTYELVDSDSEESETLWAYTTYNGKSGWIYKFQSEDRFYEGISGIASIVTKDVDAKALTIKDITELREIPSKKSKTIAVNIPKYTELDYQYYTYSIYDFGFGYVYVTYNDVSGWLKVGEDEGLWKEREAKILTLNDSISLYNDIYSNNKVNMDVPKGSELSYNYSTNKDNVGWFYVTYNNKKYWLKATNRDTNNDGYNYENIAISTDTSYYSYEYLTINDIQLYENESLKSNVLTTIPKDTKLKGKYEYVLEDEQGYLYTLLYVKYSNYQGWIKSESHDLAKLEDNKVKVLYDKKVLYEKPDTTSIIVANIPVDTELNTTYYYYDKQTWYYTTYNGKSGWIKGDNIARKTSGKYKVKNNKSFNVFEKPDRFSNIIFTLQEGNIIEPTYTYYNSNSKHNYYYITYNNKSGWFEMDYDKLQEIYNEEEYNPNIIKNPNNSTPNTPNEQPLPNINKDKNKNSKLSVKEIILYSIIGAACLSITALTTILLLNKKKNKQNSDNVSN